MRHHACLVLLACMLASGCASDRTSAPQSSAPAAAETVAEKPAPAPDRVPNEPAASDEAPQRNATDDWRSSPLQNEAAFCSVFLRQIAATLSEADRRADAMRVGLMAENVKDYLLEITGDRALSKAQIEAMLRPISHDFKPTEEDVKICMELGEAVSE